MQTGMGVASPKFSKGDRKPNKTKHYTIPILRKNKSKRVQEQGNFPDKEQVATKMP